jgi:hypothetical protein
MFSRETKICSKSARTPLPVGAKHERYPASPPRAPGLGDRLKPLRELFELIDRLCSLRHASVPVARLGKLASAIV